MAIKIYSLLKEDLSHESSVNLTITNVYSMTISHFAGSTKSTEATIPFTIEGTDKYVPEIEDVEFGISVRKKINMDALGVNEQKITDNGEDVGKYEYADNVPKRPPDLFPGFRELYKG